MKFLKSHACPNCRGAVYYIRCFEYNPDGSWRSGYRCELCSLEWRKHHLTKQSPLSNTNRPTSGQQGSDEPQTDKSASADRITVKPNGGFYFD